MANGFFPKGKELILTGEIDLIADNIKAMVVDASYTYDPTHKFLADVTGRFGPPQTLVNKSVKNGIFDADDIIFPNLSGPQVIAMIIYKDSGDVNTSTLIALINEDDYFPFFPNASNVEIYWDNGPYKIFSI